MSALAVAGTRTLMAAMKPMPCKAKNQKAPRQKPAWAKRPPIKGLTRVATPQTPARPLKTRDHSACGKRLDTAT